MPKDLHESWMSRRVKCANDLWQVMGVKREDQKGRMMALMKNWEWWGAPVGIIVSIDRCASSNAWGHTGMLLQTVNLLAEERGLGVANLEAWGNLGSVVYEYLGIDSEREVIWCGMALGYPNKDDKINQ